MKNLIISLIILSTGVIANADYDLKDKQELDLYSQYLVNMTVGVYSTDLLPDTPAIETTDIVLYIAETADQAYDPDQIGKKIVRVDFRVDGGTGLLLYQMLQKSLKEKLPINLGGTYNETLEIIEGEWLTE